MTTPPNILESKPTFEVKGRGLSFAAQVVPSPLVGTIVLQAEGQDCSMMLKETLVPWMAAEYPVTVFINLLQVHPKDQPTASGLIKPPGLIGFN